MSVQKTQELINLPDLLSSTLQRLKEKIDQIHQNAQFLRKPVLDVEEVALFLPMSKFTHYGMTSKNILPFYKLGRKIIFNRQELVETVLSRNNKFKTNAEIKSEAAAMSVLSKNR